jgi:hypothetical protein
VDGQGKERVYTQNVQCMRCETKGVDRFDPVTLDRINTRSYDYAEGYLVDRQGGLSRREVRQWIAAKKPAAGGRRLRRVS